MSIFNTATIWNVAVERCDTGGGFVGYTAQISGGGYALITACHDEGQLPQQTDKFVDVGFYRDNGEWCCVIAHFPVSALADLIVGFQFGA